jgi:hypothetical protein
MRSYILISFLLLCLFHPSFCGDVLCRTCGQTLFDSHSHLSGTILHGPRVADVESEPLLGEGGALHELRKTGVHAGTVKIATFDSPHEIVDGGVAVVVGQSIKVPIFGGFSQRLASCSRCETPLGWHFMRKSAEGKGEGEGAVSVSVSVKPMPSPTVSVAVVADSLTLLAKSGPYPFSEDAVRDRLVPVLRAISRAPRGSIGKESGCLVLPRGWWTYRYCPDVGVDQFHVDALPDGGLKEIRWSMGEAEHHETLADGTSAPLQGHTIATVSSSF